MKFELDNLVTEYTDLEASLADEKIYSDPARVRQIAGRKKSLEETVTLYREYKQIYANYDEARVIVGAESDPEMIAFAREEIASCERRITEIEERLKIALLPKDPSDDKNIIMEVRAGAGGEEAALFAHELTSAYLIFAKEQGFAVEVIDESFSENGGYREFVAKISGF